MTAAQDDLPAPDPAPRTATRRGGRRPAASNGDETRERIVQAAIDTLDAEGIVGTSARAIARRGSFNQALIFYHFGSVDGLLIEAAKAEGHSRATRYEGMLRQITTISELIVVAREIHRHEQESGSVNVLAQLLAGANTSADLRDGLHLGMVPWLSMVQEAIVRVLRESAVGTLLDPADATYAVASLFIGMELMALLDPNRDRPDALFDGVARLAPLIDTLLSNTRPLGASEIP
jgi:AcrR family transcriptional regulator